MKTKKRSRSKAKAKRTPDVKGFRNRTIDYITHIDADEGNPATYIEHLTSVFHDMRVDDEFKLKLVRRLYDEDDGLLQALYAFISELEKFECVTSNGWSATANTIHAAKAA